MTLRSRTIITLVALTAFAALSTGTTAAIGLPVPVVHVSAPIVLRAGAAFDARGTATNGVSADEPVVLSLKRRQGSGWVEVASYPATTTAGGVFAARITVPARGHWRVYASVPATVGHEPGAGSSETFKAVGKKVVALTFDDGPWRSSTDKIVASLKRYDADATFFVLGSQVRGQSARVKATAAAGNEIGVHSWGHANMARRSRSSNSADLKRCNAAITKATGRKPRWFRPPYGSTSTALRRTASSVGLRQAIWTVDTMDWKNRNASTITSRALKGTRSGSVILMHDGGGNRSATVKAVPSILETLQARGYDFVTLSELSTLGYKVR